MIDFISWNDFVITMTVVTVLYYTIAAFLFYRTEMIALFSRKKNKSGPASENHPEQQPTTYPIVGRPKYSAQPESAQLSIVADQLKMSQQSVADPEEPEFEVIDPLDATLVPAMEDLLNAARTLVDVASTSSRDEYETLFRALFERFAFLADSKYKNTIETSILKACQPNVTFKLDLEVIQSWWPATKSQTRQVKPLNTLSL
jgi:hypothetical protein